jgi:hypothetical protein
MIDCSPCDLPNQPLSVLPSCQQSGPTVFHPATVSNAGEKQIPLLHLVYEICTGFYNPQAREGRKTWLPVKYSKTTGDALLPPKYAVDQNGARREAHHLIGMVLAQRAHFLPIWAQMARAHQMEIAASIAALIKGEPLQSVVLTPLQAEMLKGSAPLPLQNAADELARGLEIARQRCIAIAHDIAVAASRREKANQRIDELDSGLTEIAHHASLISNTHSETVAHQNLVRTQMDAHFFEPDGSLTTNQNVVQFLCDLNTAQGDLLNTFLSLGQTREILEHSHQGLMQVGQQLLAERNSIDNAIRNSESRYDDLEQALLDFTLLQLEHNNVSAFAVDTQKEARPTVQREALSNDYALQPANYVDPQLAIQLQSILQSSMTAVCMFLFMHPLLKYSGDSKLACRIRKYLASAEAQQSFQALDDQNLIQPGPFAKLGVFVINALSPGSYDQRHRDLIQTEIAAIVQGMQEHGMNPEITCHSCGTNRVSGVSAQDEASNWIRDHNPPTALYNLGSAKYARLGLNDYTGNGILNGQVLLPQCRECSKRQGSVVSNVVDTLEDISVFDWLNPSFDVLAFLQQRLDNAVWVDFQRLVCNPMAGWRNPNDLSAAVAAFDLRRLVVTGNAGSFAGSDDTILKGLGAAVGCHTCTDVAVQNNPYRNIHWIADHQPPTALVARGLMELPQVVYPHCWNCSERQSKMVANLCRLFESCFGKTFKTQFVRQIKDQAWQDMIS